MTDRQKMDVRETFFAFKDRYDVVEFYHGDCIGSDAEAHAIYVDVFGSADNIYILPANVRGKRAYCKSPNIMPEDDPLSRNESIVRITTALLATPKEPREILRSGTWATIRCAHRYKKYVRVFFP